MKYVTYTAADFCADPYFVSWVVHPTEDSDRFWRRFLEEHPEKEETIRLAKGMLKSFDVRETNLSEKEMRRLKTRIWTDMNRFDNRRNRFRRYRFYAVAACITLFFSGAAFWFYTQQQSHLYETGFGEVRELRLPDGSQITLNANSRLRVAGSTKNIREVFLNGEAYFRVSKVPGSRFCVYTPEAKVEVLGTQFNVHSRRENTKVVLEEGQVLLAGKNTASVRMKPGEMALVGKAHTTPDIRPVISRLFTSWREGVLLLENTPMSQVLQNVEDTFGIRIEVSREEWLRKEMSGKLPLTSMQDFVDNLATILEAEVLKTGNGFRLQETSGR